MAESTKFKDVPVDILKTMFEESKKFREDNYETNWDRTKKYYDGKQWEGIEKIAWFQSEPIYNKTFEFVEIMRSYLSDQKWGLDIFPTGIPEDILQGAMQVAGTAPQQPALPGAPATPGNVADGSDEGHQIAQMVDKVNSVLDYVWEDNQMQLKLAQVLQLAFLYGTGFLKVRYNPNSIGETGIGQIQTEVLSPRYIYADPFATSVRDASYIIEKHPVSLSWVYENYPDFYEEVSSNLKASEEKLDFKGDREPAVASQDMGKPVDLFECWYKDGAVYSRDEESEGAGKAGSKKYPNGRYSLIVSDIVLDDKPNPYVMFPYVRFIELPRAGEFWGDATIWRALNVQDNINSLLRCIIDNGLWTAHGIWIVDTNSGLDADDFAGYGPRAVIMKNPGAAVERDAGQSVPDGIFRTLEQQVEAFDRVVGLPDVLRGIVPSRQPVGTVQMQKEAGDVRTRERSRMVENALVDLGNIWLDMVSEFWIDKRNIKSNASKIGFDMFRFSKEDMENWRFSIKVIPGSTTPRDMSDMLDKMINMRTNAGVIISDEFLAEHAGIPGLRNDVYMAKQKAKEEEQAAMAAEQAAQAPAPEGPPPEAMPQEQMPPDMMAPEIAPEGAPVM